MKPNRLEQLSDGIFAIVMTILVFDLRVPELASNANNLDVWQALVSMTPFFLSYLLSFTMLFTYWRAHHFFISVYAKNIDPELTNINGLFFLLVALVPFSSSLLGRFSENQLAIIIFGIHTILIGLCLYWMRRYVLYSDTIKNPEISKREIRGSTIRTLVPVVFAALAIPLGFYSPKLSLSLFTLAVIFNLSLYSTNFFQGILRTMHELLYGAEKKGYFHD